MRTTLLLAILVCGLGSSLSSCTPSSDFNDDSGKNVIRRGNVEQPESLDPAIASDIHTFNILYDLYEGLVALDAYGQVIPGVAETWVISEDGLTYTFSLKPDVRWSDGTPITADDFVRAFRRVAAPTTLSDYAGLLSPIVNFDRVKNGEIAGESLGIMSTGDLTLEVKLETPSAHMLGLLAMPIAFPLHGDGSDASQFQDPDHFVGNGAYVLVRRAIGEPVKLRRNAEYWDAGSVDIEFIEYFAIVDESTEFNMYRTGELDITATIPTSQIDRAKELYTQETRIGPSLALYYLAYDLTEPPFDNYSLRKALSIAIDREQLVETLGRGEQPAYAVVPPGVSNHLGDRYSWHDADRLDQINLAKQFYKDAGFTTDEPLEITLLYDAGGIHEKVALIISSMWTESLGISVNLDRREWKYFLDTRDVRKEWQVMRFSWFGDYDDPSTFTDIFHSESLQNLARYESERYDSLVELAATEINMEMRAEILTEAEKVLLDDYPIVPIYFFVSKHMVKPDILGFEHNVLDRHPSKFLRR